GMLLLQMPGSVIVVIYQGFFNRESFTTWLPYAVTALQQMLLIVMWFYYTILNRGSVSGKDSIQTGVIAEEVMKDPSLSMTDEETPSQKFGRSKPAIISSPHSSSFGISTDSSMVSASMPAFAYGSPVGRQGRGGGGGSLVGSWSSSFGSPTLFGGRR